MWIMMRTTSRSWLDAGQVGWGLSRPWSAEISETLQLPKKTVQSTLHMARTRLAAMLVGLSSAVADYELPPHHSPY
jgi:hypothetical protein